jgi:alkaline phosphatase
MMGGGRRYFDSRRADGRDLLAEHADRYTVVKNARELRALSSQGAGGGPVEILKSQLPVWICVLTIALTF